MWYGLGRTHVAGSVARCHDRMSLGPVLSPATYDAQNFNAKIRRLAESKRYRRLERWEKIWHGAQYDDRPSFWRRDVPLSERAPYIVVPLARSAGRRLTSLVLGNERFPTVKVDTRIAATRGVSEDACAALEAFILDVIDAARIKQTSRLAAEQALACGTTVIVASIREGKPALAVIPAKWCTPTFAPGSRRVVALEIRYRYKVDEEDVLTGQEESVDYWYRRTITETADTTFAPARVDPGGYEPEWVADPSQTFALPFCPVVWHRGLPDVDRAGDIDGTPLAEGLVDECEALDFSYSLGHRNARYNAEPQMVTVGAMDVDAPMGRTGSPARVNDQSERGWRDGDVIDSSAGGDKGWFRRIASAIGGAMKKAPGTVWRLKEGGDAKLLESNGQGAEIVERDITRLRRLLLDAMQVVMADPSELGSGELSARALSMMHAPMLAFADSLREEWGLDLIAPCVAMLLRLIASESTIAAGGVSVAGWQAVVPSIAAFYDVASQRFDVPLRPEWSAPYFAPSETEKQASVAAARSAVGDQPVLSARTAIAKLLPFVNDVDAELAALDEENGQRASDMRAMLGDGHDDAPTTTTEETATPTPGTDDGATANVQQTALNGAQVASLIDIISQVSTGALPRDAAVNAMAMAFQITTAEADRILGSAGRGFTPTAPADAAPAAPPGPPTAPTG